MNSDIILYENMKNIKITTWNINSIRKRIDLLQKVIDELQPDILALQETKVRDELFPKQFFIDNGYRYVYARGESSGYNGVCFASKVAIEMQPDINNIEKTRHLVIKLNNIVLYNFYVPAGGDIPDPVMNNKFAHKLDFLDHIITWFTDNKAQKFLIMGDLNIAPLANDVWSHKQLLKVVSHTPIETDKLTKLYNISNSIDAIRYFTSDEQKLYSWWSYRNRDWKKSNRGRRLDHIWVNQTLESSLVSSNIARHMRDYGMPSDHVPVSTIINIAV